MKVTVWFAGLASVVVVACGNLTSSPGDPPDTSPGGDSSATQPGTTQIGGASSGTGGTSGGVTLTITTAGTATSNTPVHPGTAGAGGQPDYPAVANLCIYPDDIPENWGLGGAGAADANGRDCTVGVVGDFNYMGCHYDLLSPTPFDVDPFAGGHSHCCYAAKLIACE